MTGESSRLIATASQTVGPFFQCGLADPRLGRLAYPETKGERIALHVHIAEGRGEPVPDALVELWQADARGMYVVADPTDTEHDRIPAFCGFGRLATGPDGSCQFETIRPGCVAGDKGAQQAAHFHLRLFMRGLLRPLDTRIYFSGDPAAADDPVLALVPEARRPTLFATPIPDLTASWHFAVHLQGERETVFFDL